MLLFACLRVPIRAQQPASATFAAQGSVLPPEVQAQLEKLKANLKAAQEKVDARAEAAALNAIGDFYFGVSFFAQALDNYSQALAQARAAKDPVQEAAAQSGTGDCYRKQVRWRIRTREKRICRVVYWRDQLRLFPSCAPFAGAAGVGFGRGAQPRKDSARYGGLQGLRHQSY